MTAMKAEVFLCLFLGIIHINSSWGRIGFKKDQSLTKIDFPPKVRRGSSGIPQGHLRPLGWQRNSEGPVLDHLDVPEPKMFYEKFVVDHNPGVFRGAVTDAPATTKWAKDDFLKKEFGDLDIHVIKGKGKIPTEMKFRKFIREYQYEDWYLANSIPQPMMPYLTLPKCLKCGLKKYLLEFELWMSAGGTSSTLHSHADHHLHCLLTGRKDFIVINPDLKDKLSFKEKIGQQGAGVSEIDVEMVNMFKHKDLGSVVWKWATLKPGDCIYIPAKYIHQVRSYGRSISWTMLWAPSPEINFSDCEENENEEAMVLEDTTPVWTYIDADKQLSNVRLNAASLRHHLMLQLREEESLSLETFRYFYNEVMSEVDDHPNVIDVWSMLGAINKGNITKQAIAEIDSSTLEKVSVILNSPHIRRHDEL